jgi:hypothetical protein
LTLWRFMLRNFIVFQSVERTQMFRENHKWQGNYNFWKNHN